MEPQNQLDPENPHFEQVEIVKIISATPVNLLSSGAKFRIPTIMEGVLKKDREGKHHLTILFKDGPAGNQPHGEIEVENVRIGGITLPDDIDVVEVDEEFEEFGPAFMLLYIEGDVFGMRFRFETHAAIAFETEQELCRSQTKISWLLLATDVGAEQPLIPPSEVPNRMPRNN